MLSAEALHVPHLVDSEITSGLRRRTLAGQLEPSAAWDALSTWQQLGMTRYPVVSLLDRIWDLRANVSAYDATYVALAEQLQCALLTGDHRLARAPGITCPVTTIS
ncbi:unannotated protein [freshwater metagenome]|uniref:Unannotated protein n=1 Tax=freshwater metagenome TaxID=449393 RepID=A0A6J7GM84_9ZZZZ